MPTATAKKKTDVFANPEDIREFMTEVPDEFLECRMSMHSWNRTTLHVDQQAGIAEQGYQCIHCKQLSVVPRFVSSGIQAGPRKPAYEEGYLAPKGFGRMNSAEGKGLAWLEMQARARQKAKVKKLATKKKTPAKKTARKQAS